MDPSTALLLIAHGSREEKANADLFWLAEELARDGGYLPVVAAFLELAEPTIEEAARRCVDKGAKRVILMPYFLSAGVHAGLDLQRITAKLRDLHPGVVFALAEPL